MYYDRIRMLREERNLTQSQVASLLDVSRSVYTRYESGALEISLDSLVKLSKFYNVSTDYLLNQTPKRSL